MTFREFECALGWEIAGRYNQQIHSALLRPPVALWREHEASLALRMPKDRMAFWVSFLPDAHRTLRPDGRSGSMTSRIGQTRFLGKSGARSATSLSNSIHGTSLEYSSSTPTVVS